MKRKLFWAIIGVVFICASILADYRTDATINSVKIAGEQQLIVNVSSTANPSPVDLYVVVGQGFNGVPFTIGDVKTYYAMFLAALTNDRRVDIQFGWTGYTYPLIQNAMIKK